MDNQDSQAQTAQNFEEAQLQESTLSAPPVETVQYASNEEVRCASEKVFRLHARLFEELAK